jgi:hypothetical protein
MDARQNERNIFPIILNSNNLVQGIAANNVYEYTFPRTADFRRTKIAVGSLSIYYSWFNILSSLGNNTYSIVFPTNAGTTTITITMPDGFYDISSVNSYLQSQFIANGLYLVDGDGNNVYYAEFVTNGNYYTVQFNSYPVPTALPAGYSNPAGMTFPVAAETPQLVVAANDFRYIIGFEAGTYPSVVQATNYSVDSTFTPQVSPVQSMIMLCDLLGNQYANPNTVLFSFSPANTQFGSLIDIKPAEYSFTQVVDGSYNKFRITFVDQSFNALQINDTNLVITLLLAQPS